MDHSLPGSPVEEILQERILEYRHALFQGIFVTQGFNLCLMSPALAGRFFTTSATWEAPYALRNSQKDLLSNGKCRMQRKQKTILKTVPQHLDVH